MIRVTQLSRELGIAISKIYYEIEKGRISAVRRSGVMEITSDDANKIREKYNRIRSLTPLKDWLKKKRMTSGKFYSRLYRGQEPEGMVKIDGRIYIDEEVGK